MKTIETGKLYVGKDNVGNSVMFLGLANNSILCGIREYQQVENEGFMFYKWESKEGEVIKLHKIQEHGTQSIKFQY
jgi:hypothetical protein